MALSWIYHGGVIFLLWVVMAVSGMDPSSSSMSQQNSLLESQLSTLGSQLEHWSTIQTQLQEQVEVLHQENIENKERIVHLEQLTEDFERRISLPESVFGSTHMETEILGSLMVIGGYAGIDLSSAEVLNPFCDFPLPEARVGHISVTTADNKTLVCGGHISHKTTALCLQFDYQSKSWQNHSSLLSENRFGSSAVTTSRGVYIIGGEYARSSSEFLATGSSVWTQGPHIPGYGVYDSCVAKLSDTEFVILGGAPDKDRLNDGIQALVYSETSEEWRKLPSLTLGIAAHSCVGLGDIVLMAGGYSASEYHELDSRRTFIFDTKTGTSREVASLTYPRDSAAVAFYKGKAVILGGHDGIGWRSDGEMWNMDTETWEEADIYLNIGREKFSLVTLTEEMGCN